MSVQRMQGALAIGLLLFGGWAATMPPTAWGQQDDGSRKAKSKVAPAYPELARRMKIAGVVKVQVTVTPSGTVKDAKVIGGHPLLANAVMDAVKKWRYEARPQETVESLEFRFDPNE